MPRRLCRVDMNVDVKGGDEGRRWEGLLEVDVEGEH